MIYRYTKMKTEKIYGLIGRSLSHSFSKRYFTEKFAEEGIKNCRYELFELSQISEFLPLVRTISPTGLNVTIPYKEAVMPYLNRLDRSAERIGAANVIKFETNGKLAGYNSDYYGLYTSLKRFLGGKTKIKALILGTGGAAKAAKAVLEDMDIGYWVVSRKPSNSMLGYKQVDKQIIEEHQLIINCTPLGMSPAIHRCPDIAYEYCGVEHYLYDLVYNPQKTRFMQRGISYGSKTKNGSEMLALQAEKSWQIWNR